MLFPAGLKLNCEKNKTDQFSFFLKDPIKTVSRVLFRVQNGIYSFSSARSLSLPVSPVFSSTHTYFLPLARALRALACRCLHATFGKEPDVCWALFRKTLHAVRNG